jgi:hypothetical protein
VFFFGSAHSNDILNPMFNDIESHFLEFCPELVLIEGGYDRVDFDSKEKAIENGEMAFVSYLSSKHKIKKLNVEPSDKYIDSILLTKYSREEIFTMYILRQTFQYINISKYSDIDFEALIMVYANIINNRLDNKDANQLTFQEVLSIVENVSGISIADYRKKEVQIRRYIFRGGNIINTIHSEVVQIRDHFAIDTIINSLYQYDKVFVIMGNQHLMNQEKIIREKMLRFEE